MYTNTFSFSQQPEFCKSEKKGNWNGMPTRPPSVWVRSITRFTLYLYLRMITQGEDKECKGKKSPPPGHKKQQKERSHKKERISLPPPPLCHPHLHLVPNAPSIPLDSRDSLIRTPRVHWSENYTRRKGWVSHENLSSSIWLRTFGDMRQCKYQQIKTIDESKLKR